MAENILLNSGWDSCQARKRSICLQIDADVHWVHLALSTQRQLFQISVHCHLCLLLKHSKIIMFHINLAKVFFWNLKNYHLSADVQKRAGV